MTAIGMHKLAEALILYIIQLDFKPDRRNIAQSSNWFNLPFTSRFNKIQFVFIGNLEILNDERCGRYFSIFITRTIM